MDAATSKQCGFVTLRACKKACEENIEIRQDIEQFKTNVQTSKMVIVSEFVVAFKAKHFNDIQEFNKRDHQFKKTVIAERTELLEAHEIEQNLVKQMSQLDLETIKTQVHVHAGVDTATRHAIYSTVATSVLTNTPLPETSLAQIDKQAIKQLNITPKDAYIQALKDIRDINVTNTDITSKAKIDAVLQKLGF